MAAHEPHRRTVRRAGSAAPLRAGHRLRPARAAVAIALAVAAPAVPAFEVQLEAEEGRLTAPMEILADPLASGEKSVRAVAADAGAVDLPFDLPERATVHVWARVLTPSRAADAVWFAVDGEPDRAHRFFTGRNLAVYEWFQLHDRKEPYTPVLAAGRHRLRFTAAEPGFRIDRLFVTDDPDAAPEGFVRPPSCGDAARNQDETGIDCGGDVCGPCATGQACRRDGDCGSGVCDGGTCRAAACDDGIRNGDEAGVDCGGGCDTACRAVILPGLLPLVGDPGFEPRRLTPAVRRWHERLLESMRRADPEAEAAARSRNLFLLGRKLNDVTTDLLFGLRATGDLHLLDRAAALWELARAGLEDAWCDGSTDGFRNWLWLEDRGSAEHYCKDLHALDETMTHGGLAMLAYALDANRSLDPRYGAQADRWTAYLEGDFLAKWSARAGARGCGPVEMWEKPGCGIYRRFTHARMNELRLALALWRITGREFYHERAAAIASDLASAVEAAPTRPGAYRWKHQVSGEDEGFQRINYAAYYARGMLEMHLERIEPYGGEEEMQRYTSTFRDVVLDPERSGISSGRMADRVDGSGDRPLELDALAGFGRWDPSGALLRLAERSYAPGIDGMHVAAGALLAVSDRGAAPAPAP